MDKMGNMNKLLITAVAASALVITSTARARSADDAGDYGADALNMPGFDQADQGATAEHSYTPARAPDPWLDNQSWQDQPVPQQPTPKSRPIDEQWHTRNDGLYPLDTKREQQARDFLHAFMRARGLKPAGE